MPPYDAIYALYGGNSKKYVAYVGSTSNLKRRIQQHLIGRDSSISTGTSATGLNPDYVTEVRWWGDHRYKGNGAWLHASELAAFDILNPVLRSRRKPTKEAEEWYGYISIKRDLRKFFREVKPSGVLTILTFDGLVQRIELLEERIKNLEEETDIDASIA